VSLLERVVLALAILAIIVVVGLNIRTTSAPPAAADFSRVYDD
jgi:hypothetical protein